MGASRSDDESLGGETMSRFSKRIVGLLSLCCLISFSAVALASDDRWESIGLAATIGSSLVIDRQSATIYAATESGVFKSTDAGTQWVAANSGIGDLNIHGVALSSSGLFALTARGLFRSTDGAASWRSIRAAAGTNVIFRSFAVSSSTVYASTARCALVRFDCSWTDGVLLRSIDAGATWTSAGLSGDVVTAIAIDPMSPSTVFAVLDGPVNHGIYRSRDGGFSFTLSSSGLIGSNVFEICVSRALPSTVYVTTGAGEVFRSTDAGSSWTAAGEGLPRGDLALSDDPTSSTTVYAGTDISGVFKTTDGGDHWSAVGTGLPTDSRVTAIAVDPSSPSTVYAETFRDGVFKITQSASSACSSSPTALCLNSGRFQVDVSWTAASLGRSGGGRTIPLTGDTGAFWFFSPSNLELMVKVLDGRGINGHFWFFYGALSDVAYTITVTDTESGRVKTYTNPQGRLASAADTETF